jgi:drug/metabolite transporter (DMT)-like permease
MNGRPEEPSETAPSLVGTLAMLGLVIFAWGGNYTWIKIALRDIGPWTFNATRYCGAACLIGLVLVLHGGARKALPVRGERVGLAAIGLLSGAVLTVLITVSLLWIESTRTILLIYTNPVWTLLLSGLLLGERLTPFNVAGVILGLAGIAMLTNPWALPWEASTLPGILAAVTGSLAWAFGSVLYRRRRWRSTFWQQVFWQLAASGGVTAAAAVLFEWDRTVTPTPRLLLILLYNVLIPTALAFWCWSQALTRVKPSTASQVLLLSPVFGVAQSHLVLGEVLSETMLASAAAVLAGAALTFVRPRSRAGLRPGSGPTEARLRPD